MEEKNIRPQDKWNAKAGLISKSYKQKKSLLMNLQMLVI